MERGLGALRENGIDDIVVVRGYCGQLINYPKITYRENPNFKKNNILGSLFFAEDEINDDFIFSYSDIVYDKIIVEKLIQSDADIALIVDVDWIQKYKGRSQHPISQAELVKTENSRVVKIGKNVVKPVEAHGEFIGLAKFSKMGAEAMKATFHRVAKEYPNIPFHQAACLEKAYMTDMIQELVDTGLSVKSVDINGGWIEVDTPQDLTQAQRLFSC